MEEIKKAVDWDYVYVATDGREFVNRKSCEVYEKYCNNTIYDVLKDYVVTDEENIKAMKNNEFAKFSYMLILKKVPEDICQYIRLVDKSDSYFDVDNYYSMPCLYYNDWTSAYNGSYSRNGWGRISNEEDLIEEIEKLTERLEILRNFAKKA